MNFDNQVIQAELFDAFLVASKKAHPKLSNLSSFQTFAKYFFNVAYIDGYSVLSIDSLVGKVLFAWNQIQQKESASPKVVVSNPTLAENGWQSSSTVLCILTEDMPFLIDSIQMYFSRHGVRIHRIHSVLFTPERDSLGNLVKAEYKLESNEEAFLFFEVSRSTGVAYLEQLSVDIRKVLEHVSASVNDFPRSKECLQEVIAKVEGLTFEGIWAGEGQAFLEWVLSDHFTFLGFEKLICRKGQPCFESESASQLGICREGLEHEEIKMSVEQFTPEQMQQNHIIIDKSAVKTVVHRPAYPDQIIVKVKEGGQCVAYRFLGLFTSAVYTEEPSHIPIIRTKLSSILARACFDKRSHNGKSLKQILKVLPRDELFQASEDRLFTMAMDILSIQERQQIKVFLRKDEISQFYSCLTYIPKEIYNAELRFKIQAILMEVLEGEDIEFNTYFSESVLARTHFLIRSQMNTLQHEKFKLIEERIFKVAKTWVVDLSQRVNEVYGEEKGEILSRNIVSKFPLGYQERFLPQYALVDVQHIDALSGDSHLRMCSYTTVDLGNKGFYFKIFNDQSFIPLSVVVPILEHLGVEVLKEHPYEVVTGDHKKVWINDFKLQYKAGNEISIDDIRDIFHRAFATIWIGESESDPFNQLITLCQLDWREVSVLRAYARYMKQLRVGFSQLFIATTLAKHAKLCRLFVSTFELKFKKVCDPHVLEEAIAKFNEAIEVIEDISEDKVFKFYASVLNATVRTSFYINLLKPVPDKYFSFKISPSKIPDVPKPVPMSK